jgi:hypothetical protein
VTREKVRASQTTQDTAFNISLAFGHSAEALGILVEDLLIVDADRTAGRKAAESNGRPAGKVREVFDRVSKLPRRQQKHIVNWVALVRLRSPNQFMTSHPTMTSNRPSKATPMISFPIFPLII